MRECYSNSRLTHTTHVFIVVASCRVLGCAGMITRHDLTHLVERLLARRRQQPLSEGSTSQYRSGLLPLAVKP